MINDTHTEQGVRFWDIHLARVKQARTNYTDKELNAIAQRNLKRASIQKTVKP